MFSPTQSSLKGRQIRGEVYAFLISCLVLGMYFIFANSRDSVSGSITKFELLGLALGLFPSATWAGQFIAKRISLSNLKAVSSILVSSQVINLASSIGLSIGTTIALDLSGVLPVGGVRNELYFVCLVFLVTALPAFILVFILAWPFHLWLKREANSS